MSLRPGGASCRQWPKARHPRVPGVGSLSHSCRGAAGGWSGLKEKGQESDGVGLVERVVVVGVRGVLAGKLDAAGEEVEKNVDGVGDIRATVGVGVAAPEGELLRRQRRGRDTDGKEGCHGEEEELS